MNPLAGRLVLDCSTLLPAPYIGKLLAEQGAEVYKVESPSRPDPARDMAEGVYYRDLNAAKKPLSFDLTQPSERERFRIWVEKADVLIEAYRPRVRAKLGLEHSILSQWNPKLIHLSLEGYGEDSPLANRPAHDLNFQARSGLLSLATELPAVPLSDIVPPMEAAFQIACALAARERTGKGAHLRVGILESLKRMQSKWVAEYRATGILPRHGETLVTGRYPCYDFYRPKDRGLIAVAAMEPAYWSLFCETIGAPELKSDGYAEGSQAARARQLVASKIAERSLSEWKQLFDRVECCADAVLDYSEAFGDGL